MIVCLRDEIKIEMPSLLLLPSVPSDPRNDPFPHACHLPLNNGVTVSLKANPWCAFYFFFFFFLTPSQTWFRGSNKSYSSLAKCLKCILSHESENPILSLQCEISDVFLLVWSAVLLIHTPYCWHKMNMVSFKILEEVRRDLIPVGILSTLFFFNTGSQDAFLKQNRVLIKRIEKETECSPWYSSDSKLRITRSGIVSRVKKKNSAKELFHP